MIVNVKVAVHCVSKKCTSHIIFLMGFIFLGVHLAKCSEHNQVCSKEGALIVLCAMRGDNDDTSN